MLHSRSDLRRLAVAGAAALIAAISVAAATARAQAAGPQAGPTALVSPEVDWPAGDRAFPAGPGVAVVSSNCTGCHSAGMILNQPTLSQSTWNAEVHKMISVYKAPVSEADAKVIVDYLVAIKGPDACGGTGAAREQAARDGGTPTARCP